MRWSDDGQNRTDEHLQSKQCYFVLYLKKKVIRLIDWHFVCVWVSVLRIEDSILVLVVLHLLLCWSEGREKERESSQNIQAHARMRTWARWFHLSSFSFLSLSLSVSLFRLLYLLLFVCSCRFYLLSGELDLRLAAKQQQQQRKRGKKIKK